MSDENKDWKLKLRYGKTTTPYKHFTVIADGIVGDLSEGFSCRKVKAWMGMKVWASSIDEAGDMIKSIGEHIGFTVKGRIEIYSTEPQEAPEEKPFGYDIQFTPYD